MNVPGVFIRICKWREFQHYSDRSPPWVKLHRDLLASRTWVGASNETRVLAIASIILAAATDNLTPLDVPYIKRVAYLEFEPDFGPLLDKQFLEFVDESGKVLARSSQDASKLLSREEDINHTEAESYLPSLRSGLGTAVGEVIPLKTINPDSGKSETARATWAAFAAAYLGRYDAAPVRNGKTNGQVAQLVKRLGADAPAVAAFYVGHNDARYVREGHTLGMLLAHAEKLATEWRTGRRSTTTAATQQDRLQATGDTFTKLLAEARHEPENP